MRHCTKELLTIVIIAVLCWGTAACSGEPDGREGETEAAELAESPAEHAVEDSGTEAATAESQELREGGEHAETRGRGGHEEGRESQEDGEHREGGEAEEHEGGEHDEDGEGEESGVYVARGDTWDATLRGARLVLAFDPGANSFNGTVENTTDAILCAVRVEVHLSTGSELGPTERTDMLPGQSIDVSLPSGAASFESWTAHPEVSRCGRD